MIYMVLSCGAEPMKQRHPKITYADLYQVTQLHI